MSNNQTHSNSALNSLLLAAVFAGAGAVGHARQASAQTLDELLTNTKSDFAARCSTSQTLLENADQPMDAEMARARVFLFCDCMPTELDKASKQHTPLSNPKDDVKAIAQTALTACSAKYVRGQIASNCSANVEKVAAIRDKMKYCECFRKEVDQLSDSQIAEQSKRKYRESQEKAEALKRGETPPPPKPSPLDDIDARCRAQATE